MRCIQLSPVACQPCNAFCIVTVALGRSAAFAARLDVVSTLQAPTPALFPWLYFFGSRNSAAWEESAFVRMSGVPWFRSYCHLLGGGGEKSAESVSPISSLQPFIWAVSCVNREYYQSAAVISQQTRLVYRQFQPPVLARRVNLFHLQNGISAISGFTYELTGLFVLAGYFFTS